MTRPLSLTTTSFLILPGRDLAEHLMVVLTDQGRSFTVECKTVRDDKDDHETETKTEKILAGRIP